MPLVAITTSQAAGKLSTVYQSLILCHIQVRTVRQMSHNIINLYKYVNIACDFAIIIIIIIL